MVEKLFSRAFLDFGQWKGGRGDWKQNWESEGGREEDNERERKRVITIIWNISKSEREIGWEWKKERMVWIGKQKRNETSIK